MTSSTPEQHLNQSQCVILINVANFELSVLIKTFSFDIWLCFSVGIVLGWCLISAVVIVYFSGGPRILGVV